MRYNSNSLREFASFAVGTYADKSFVQTVLRDRVSVVDEYGCCFNCFEIYYTLETAFKEAKKVIATLLD